MKNRFVLTVALILLTLSATLFTRAHALEGPSAQPFALEEALGEDRLPPRFEAVAEVLDLTPAQVSQIKTLLGQEMKEGAALRQRMHEGRKELRGLEISASFDEAAVRALARRQADTQVELAVHRARVQSRIFALLTPAQQELAKKLHPLMAMGPGRHGGKPGMR